jgi:hypothetical protein
LSLSSFISLCNRVKNKTTVTGKSFKDEFTFSSLVSILLLLWFHPFNVLVFFLANIYALNYLQNKDWKNHKTLLLSTPFGFP